MTKNASALLWRVSTFSGSGGSCVQVARSTDGDVLVRNSNHPEAGTLALSPAEMSSWVVSATAGELDDLTV